MSIVPFADAESISLRGRDIIKEMKGQRGSLSSLARAFNEDTKDIGLIVMQLSIFPNDSFHATSQGLSIFTQCHATQITIFLVEVFMIV